MFEDLVNNYKNRFRHNGEFYYKKDGNLRRTITEAKVPSSPGVYIISADLRGTNQVLYIGKAGAMQRNGRFKKQKLFGRLMALQNWKGVRTCRRKFYNDRMNELEIREMKFTWFVTFTDAVKILPVKAESDLLQYYYNKFKELPPWNNVA